MLTASKVANYFIKKAHEDNVRDLDQLKLQKLCYYAYGWAFPNDLGPLFTEDIEAWPHGPVIRELYLQFMDNGKKPITSLASEVVKDNGSVKLIAPELSAEDKAKYGELLDAVWDTFKGFTGIQLSNSTHQPDSPWDTIRKTLGLDRKHKIPDPIIEQHFKNLAGALEK